MPADPPWGDAKPLAGCEVIRPPPTAATPSARGTPGKKKPNAVVEKIAAANVFLDRSAQTLPPAAALVWLLLWRDERGGTARTAVSDLARRSGLSARTVKRALAALRRGGFAVPVHRGTPGTGPAVYRLRATSPGGVTDGP
jgi:hypothetical protein